MKEQTAMAWPRAGLLGNPSDLYEGRGIGFTFENFAARVRWVESAEHEAEILLAARSVLPQLGIDAAQSGEWAWQLQSDIPRQVGLSGSSAIILAALRLACTRAGIQVSAERLAELALRAETDFMGISAGPMDRMVQAHEGVVAMDFASGVVERLHADSLPLLRILIDQQPGQDSGGVHAPVRDRWLAGEPQVRATMAQFRPLVDEALLALQAADFARLITLINRNFDLRAEVFPIGKRDRAAVELARGFGLGAKFCGSGGAILAAAQDASDFMGLDRAASDIGFDVIEPQITNIAP